MVTMAATNLSKISLFNKILKDYKLAAKNLSRTEIIILFWLLMGILMLDYLQWMNQSV